MACHSNPYRRRRTGREFAPQLVEPPFCRRYRRLVGRRAGNRHCPPRAGESRLRGEPLGAIAKVLVKPAALKHLSGDALPLAVMEDLGRDEQIPSDAQPAVDGEATFFCSSYQQMRELVSRDAAPLCCRNSSSGNSREMTFTSSPCPPRKAPGIYKPFSIPSCLNIGPPPQKRYVS